MAQPHVFLRRRASNIDMFAVTESSLPDFLQKLAGAMSVGGP